MIAPTYTHGVSEKGADFILTKVSEELGDTEYVGVVVKAGKITQNYSSLREQISECTLRRITTNGKKEIYLSEVWVACNGTISNNARDKIHDEYKTQKIKFLDINTIADLTQKYIPDYGIDIDLRSSNYLHDQSKKASERMSRTTLTSEQSDLFIEQDIIKLSNDFNGKDEKVDIFEQIDKKKIAFIEAPMGGGKSTIINKIIKHYSDIEIYKNKRILPIYIDHQYFINECESLEDTIQDTLERYSIKSEDVDSYLVIVDGLDEIKESEEVITEKLISFSNEAHEANNKKLIITSRSINDEKIEGKLEQKWSRYRIRPLSLSQVIKFIESACSSINIKNRLIEDLKKSELFKVLPKTPISAIILARLLSEGNEELPANITELYSKYFELSLGRWDVSKGLKTTKQYEALDKLVSLLAKYMLDNSLPALATSEAKQIFKQYLDDRNLQLDHNQLFDDLVQRSDILSLDKANKTISFRHRSFAEFFYAKYMTTLTEVQISADVFHPYWSNVYFFYTGMKRDCPDLLKKIMAVPVIHEGHKLSRLINMGNFLLAGYQSPYDVISQSLQKIFDEFGKYYDDINSSRIESGLAKLPSLHLLALFRQLLAENYSYEFFTPAIKQAYEDKYLSLKDDSDIYTLFFLDIARDELGIHDPYTALSSKGDDLPMPIQLAMIGISKAKGYKNTNIQRLEKKIRKRRRDSVQVNQHIKNLYIRSIDGSYELPVDGQKKLPKRIKAK